MRTDIIKRHFWVLILLSMISLSGCLEKRITKDPSELFFPTEFEIQDAIYSPDGKYIVFASKMDGGSFFDIWKMTYEGNDPEQITFDDYDQIQPSMSHDNNKIVYSAYNNPTRSWNLWEYAFSSKTNRQLTNDIFNETNPIFSHDGSGIIFSSNESFPKNVDEIKTHQRIWVLHLKNGTRNLLYDSYSKSGYPALLKNSEEIIFSHYELVGLFQIFRRNHFSLYITHQNGTLSKTVNIHDSDILFPHSLDENNIVFSIQFYDYGPTIGTYYGNCVGLYNFEIDNYTILLADRNYSIERISYSPYDNSILINCRENDTVFLRKLIFNPVDENDNRFADNIEETSDSNFFEGLETYIIIGICLLVLPIIGFIVFIIDWRKRKKVKFIIDEPTNGKNH